MTNSQLNEGMKNNLANGYIFLRNALPDELTMENILESFGFGRDGNNIDFIIDNILEIQKSKEQKIFNNS